MNSKLEKLKNDLSDTYRHKTNELNLTITGTFKAGFDAGAEHKDQEWTKVVRSLLDALEEIAIEQKFYIKHKDYFSEVVRLNLTAQEALSDYKAEVEKL